MTGPLAAALLCLAGAFLVLVGVGNAWVLVDVAGGPLLPARSVPVTGGDLAGGLRALGLVGLAGVPALAATRGRGRQAVGLLLLLTGLAVALVVARLELTGLRLDGRALISDPVREAGGTHGAAARATGWPYATACGGLLVAAAGLLMTLRGRRWSALGRRYDAPSEPRPAGERDLWEALDRGEDPTGPQDPPSSGAAPRG